VIAKVKVPKLSTNVEEATLTAWFKAEGEAVRRGERLLEMTTDKAAFEIESPRAGVVRRLVARRKSVLPVGYIVALVGEAAEPLPDADAENRRLLGRLQARPRGRAAAPPPSAPRPAAAAASAPPTGAVRATPAARRLARERAVDLAAVRQRTGAEIVTESVLRSYLEGGGA